MNYYFAYGSNMSLEGMQRRCPDAVPIRTHRLHGWRLVFRGVADIEPAPGKFVDGCIYQITDDCEKSLDRYEGFPRSYTKATFRSRSVDGRRRRVMFYVMPENNRCWSRSTEALPASYYLRTLIDGFIDWRQMEAAHVALEAALESAKEVARQEDSERREWLHGGGRLLDVYSDDFVEDDELLDALDARQIPLNFTAKRKVTA